MVNFQVARGIEVHSFEALEELAVALTAFAGDACYALNAADAGAQATIEEMQRREREIGGEIGRLEGALACCDDEDDGVADLERRLDYARVRQEAVSRALSDVSTAYDAFKREAWALRAVVFDGVPAARGFLEQKLHQLRTYAAIPLPARPLAGGAPGGTGTAGVPPLHLTPLPAGFCWVALDQIDGSRLVEGEFRKVPFEEMRRGFHSLIADVIPRMRSGRVNGETFSALDASRGVAYAEGTQRVFDAFFGREPIRLDRRVGEPLLTIINGQHRIEVARRLAITHIPAQVEGAT